MAACLSASAIAPLVRSKLKEGKDRTDETVGVVPPQVLNHVARMTGPRPDLAVRLHRVDEVTPAVLQRNRITVIVEHLGNEVHCVRVEGKARVMNDAERVELVTESGFGYDELGGVGAAAKGLASCTREVRENALEAV